MNYRWNGYDVYKSMVMVLFNSHNYVITIFLEVHVDIFLN